MLSLGAHDGRPDMTQHGIEAVLAHLAKLPPPGSLTLAEQRAQYERAERAFPIPPEVAVRRVTAPVAPAAVEDAVLAYRWLAEQGIRPARLVIAGDSAGGGLTVATLVALRERGLALPAAGVCISPWVDLTCSAPSYAKNAAADPIVRPALVSEMARAYLADADPRTPLASPLYADLRGLPPL